LDSVICAITQATHPHLLPIGYGVSVVNEGTALALAVNDEKEDDEEGRRKEKRKTVGLV